MDLVPAADKAFFKAEASGRVTCTLNGHTFPALEEPIKAFVRGSKYQRLRALAEEEAALKKYEPLIVQSRNFPDKLFCALTCHIVNKQAASIEKHIRGKKYCKAKELLERGEHALLEEPDLESSEEDASLVVTDARCAGGDEQDAAGPSGKGGDVMMEVDRLDKAPVAGVAPTDAAAFDADAQARKSKRVRPARPKRIRR